MPKQNQDFEQTLNLLKLLAEENRLKILYILKGGEHCVCEIIERFGLPQNLVSHHLSKLKEAELIQGRKDGVWVHYSLTDKGRKVADIIFLFSNKE